MRRKDTGFTLIEILVVLSLMGVLFGLSIGFVAQAGKGNLLLQTAQSLVSQLAMARAQSQGNDTAYVKVEMTDGETRIRSYRNRQVFHWPCEDFTRASEENVLSQDGNVDMAPEGGNSSGEGRHILFGGGSVRLQSMADLAFTDGFSIKCRINPATGGGGNAPLFQKGTYFKVALMSSEPGRFDVECKIKLLPDKKGEGHGDVVLRTGYRGPEVVAEWAGPVVAGRWQDITVSYDRNDFVIYVNGRLRAILSDRRNAMRPETTSPFVIGAGYTGGFDSLLIAGIFEDSEDTYFVSPQVVWVNDEGKVWVDAEGKQNKEFNIHFRNRALDPQQHASPLELVFKLNDEKGAKRRVQITLSGEGFIKELGQ